MNLALRVGPPGADGYHAVATVLQTISLADLLVVGLAGPRLSLRADGPALARHGLPLVLDVRGMELPGNNTVVQAAALVAGRIRERGAGELPVLRARLHKRIPAGAGLGGGSSDAAAMLVACNRLWAGGLRHGATPGSQPPPGGASPREGRLGPGALDGDELLELATAIGADVPFFLEGGTALGTGRGDEVEPLEALETRWMVVAAPPEPVSTPAAYAAFDADRPDPAAPQPPGFCPRGNTAWMENDLAGPVTRRWPAVETVRRALLEAGADGAWMTGSGAASFGLFDGRRSAARAAGELAGAGWWARAAITVTARQHRRALMGVAGDASR